MTQQHNVREASESKPHQLKEFLRQDVAEIAAEYDRIRARTLEDPGTAGDEGEENWAALLRNWLPESYRVVTKGRVLGVDGAASPQVDVLVLRPSYPRRLVDKKVYLVSGVAGVFECKTTLRSSHLHKASATRRIIRQLSVMGTGSPQRELAAPPTFGVLAHSHDWNGPSARPKENVDNVLAALHSDASHPRDLIEMVCVADLACWDLMISTCVGPAYLGANWPNLRQVYQLPDEGGMHTAYTRWTPESAEPEPNPVAVLVSRLIQRMAREDPEMRPLADYFRLAGLWGSSQGALRSWPLRDVYSEAVASRLFDGAAVNGYGWDEWSQVLP